VQDRYVGDIGDFAKYGLLRALSRGRRLGVAWYLNPYPDQRRTGEDVGYLFGRKELRCLDPELFDAMKYLVCADRRSVAAVESSGILGEAVFASEPLDIAGRTHWFARVEKRLIDCDLVFADPDTGLVLDRRFKPTTKDSRKQMPFSEAKALSRNRCTVILHHHGRQNRHRTQISDWMSRLPGCSHAYYWRRVRNRTFFVLNPAPEIKNRLQTFEEHWKDCGDLIRDDGGDPDGAVL